MAAEIPETARFQRKRETILDAASALINEHGAKGMTLADVAQSVGLNTTSVTYYFKRKEQLAAACYDRTMARLEAVAHAAAAQADPRARVRHFLHSHFTLQARVRRGEERSVTVLSDMRAMEGPDRAALGDRFRGILRTVRGFFGPPSDEAAKALHTARTHVLMENMLWLPGWLFRYFVDDFDRVEQRLFDLFDHGIAPANAHWAPVQARLDADALLEGPELARHNFLVAATRLINERGYRGASVDRIASELNVTKGSFYHHLDAKDDLVVECFRHSFLTLSRAQREADAAGGAQWERLCSAMAMLLEIQLGTDGPLLRTTALQALPPDMRNRVVERSNRLARRFAGTMIDGISEGSIRAIDPIIAAQSLMVMLNAAYELRTWSAGLDRSAAVSAYASTLAFGLFDPPRI
ncbi:TetR/AcrR family transcriptional regulator [Sphingobium boeckii]|uniref:AcrR family transcriptional regulator n=1 Tax=Sphingobium boeckii TaxID=1082345 RepID=A0A7W9AJ24_9SPHN|nr:TetR/AcrR family transcriptional regulator [Sphingobium boeckii]MBB5686588.1 AcrR family transcriptional regulator [Sphingobium boeckii]